MEKGGVQTVQFWCVVDPAGRGAMIELMPLPSKGLVELCMLTIILCHERERAAEAHRPLTLTVGILTASCIEAAFYP